jgi:hypothetical protein
LKKNKENKTPIDLINENSNLKENIIKMFSKSPEVCFVIATGYILRSRIRNGSWR